ncbi:MAG: hypothetical protein R3C11_00105 [Planctomycetaceae bacterium]
MPVESVQHHHAHIVAGMLEHNWLDRQVLGVAFDGTGWGDDQTIWGGEFLLTTTTSYERVAHLRPFALPGGEGAVKKPWRVAFSLVTQAMGEAEAFRQPWPESRLKPIMQLLNSRSLSPMTSSAGRLFDGVAALVLGVEQSDFEGQAAMLLEAICDHSESGSYEFSLHEGTPLQLDWRPLIRQIIHDRNSGISPGMMAMKFHRGLAQVIARLCRQYVPLPVVLGGGVFQNRCLVELLREEIEQNCQECGLPGVIPPNDGGLAAGQLGVASARAIQRGTNSCV